MGIRRGMLAAVVAFSAALALGAAPAGAVLLRLSDGQWISYLPMKGAKSLPSTPVSPFSFKHDNVFSNLDYSGGNVMPSNTNWLVYWDPTGTSSPAFNSDFITGINQWFTDIAHDSGGNQGTDSVATQYNDATGATAAYASSFSAATNVIHDLQTYPTSCTQGFFFQHCITDDDLAAEVDRVAQAHAIPTGTLTNEIWIFTPSTVEICSSDLSSCSANSADGNGQYCAYHSATSKYIYANQPYVVNASGCNDGNFPNSAVSANTSNTPDADAELEGGIPHEHSESVTDPFPPSGWVNIEDQSDGGENGDKCSLADRFSLAQPFGAPVGTTTGGKSYNQVINGHLYWYQMEWSNSGHQCLQRYTASGSPPVASFVYCASNATASVFDASGSSATGGIAQFQWEFNEQTATPAQVEATSPTTTFNFPTTGSRAVALTVFAADGTSTGTALHVTPGGPCAAASIAAASTALVGQSVAFDGSASTATSGSLTYKWSFGDGSAIATTAKPSHTYAAAGHYTVTLTVVDGAGTFGTKTASITVNDQPTASLTFSPAAPVQGSPVSFTGSGTDPDGSIASYAWNFGDGTTGTTASASHTYASAGSFSVTLTVTDSAGLTATSTQTVTVAAKPVPPPPPPPSCSKVPSLKGLSLSAATSKLKKAGCKLGRVKKPKKPKKPAPTHKKYVLVVASQTAPKNTVVGVTLRYVTVKK